MSSRLIFLLTAIIVVWILAFNSGRNLAFNLAYLLSAVLAFSYLWSWFSIRSVNLRRFTRTRRSQVGQYAEETFEIRNQSNFPKLWLEVEDYSQLPWHNASRVISSLGRNGAERWQIRNLCTQRGRYRLGPMSLRSGDPLGIFEVEEDLPETGFIVVYPLVVDLVSFEPSISDLSGGEARRHRTNQVTTNVATIRDYAPGDSLNRIHWPTTARARRLMTKEFELDPTADIWIYLDLCQNAQIAMPWTPMPPEQGVFALGSRNASSRIELPPITTEYAISIAASLSRYFLMRNRAVGMSAYGRVRQFLQTDRGERQLNKMLEAMAVMEGGGELPFANVIAADSVRLNRNDTIIAISADPTPTWSIALHDSQRRGVNSIAIVVDGSTFGHSADYDPLFSELEAASVPFYRIQRGDSIQDALSQPAKTIEIH